MPATSVTKQADGSQLYSFAETPVMSSYLLYLGMGDLERKTVMSGKTEIGVVTRRGVSSQGDYALAAAKRLLPYYNDYFGQPYPLPKLDMIAGPGSSQFFGAMENWGRDLLFREHAAVRSQGARPPAASNISIPWWRTRWRTNGSATSSRWRGGTTFG